MSLPASASDEHSENDDDPLVHVRENRSEMESLAAQTREDSLAAWARVMLALVDDREPSDEDLDRIGLNPEEDLQC